MTSFNVPLPIDLNEILRSNSKVTLSSDQPPAPDGSQNVSWQVDEFGNLSASAPITGGGTIGGSGTAGFLPQFATATTLENSPIDNGVTVPDTLTLNKSNILIETDTNEMSITGGAFGGFEMNNNGSGGTNFYDSGGGGISFVTNSQGALPAAIQFGASQQIQMNNNGPAGTQISDNGGGGISINPSPGNLILNGFIVPGNLYSAAGTPLPDPSTVPQGAEATVSDATAPTYMGAYVSGGAVTCKVISDGTTNWFTH